MVGKDLGSAHDGSDVVPRRTPMRAVLEASLEAVVGMDETGRIIDWNAQAAELFGWSRDEALGRRVSETIIPMRFRAAHEQGLRRFLENGARGILDRKVEVEALHRSGREIPVELRITPVREEDRWVFYAFLSDLRPRRAAEADREALLRRLDEQRRLFEAILAHTPAGIALVSRAEQRIEFANPAFEAFSPGREVIGRTRHEAWPEVAREADELYARVFATGEAQTLVDQRYVLRRGPSCPPEERWFTFSLVPVRGAGGEVDAVLVLSTETTEHVRASRQISDLAGVAWRRAAQLRGIIDNMAEAVLVCDDRGRLTLVNAAAVKLLGGATDLVGRTMAELSRRFDLWSADGLSLPPEDVPLSRALRGETLVLHDSILREPGEGRYRFVRSSAAPIRDESGVIGAVQVARDLTEVERLDKVREQFVRTAAHELNTPVAVVSGYVQALQRHFGALPEPSRPLIEAIGRGAARIQRIVRDLIYVTRIDLGHLDVRPEPIRLDELARAFAARASYPDAQVAVRVVRADPVTIEADREGVEQVLRSLVENALRYSRRGDAIDLSVVAEGGEAILSVRDRGPGIPRAAQARMFERFYRAHTDTSYDYEGLGVGLFISREITRAHGGRMWFESEEGAGSTFHAAFPRGRASATR